jgi:serine/threonine-protein kinase
VTALSSGAAAQPAGNDAKAAAQALFDRAKALSDSGRHAEACPLFAESQRLDAGIGTLLFLSDCYEQVGRTASAWAGFLEAASIAKVKEQPSREQIARDRAAALAPKLSRLSISVAPENRVPGFQVKRGGVVVGEPVWGTLLPVDPGEYTIEADAPSRKSWSTRVTVGAKAATVTVTVPALEKQIGPPSDTKASSSDSSRDSFQQKAIGVALGGVGVAGLVVGTVFGLDAFSTYDEAQATCRDGNLKLCTEDGVSLQQDASSAALVSTIAFAVGAAAIAAGAIVFVLSPSGDESPEKAAWTLRVGPGGGSLGGAF